MSADALGGRTLLVIGGGNVAIDAACTARRLGAASVIVACLEKPEEMPPTRRRSRVGPTAMPVLIRGESGTGKELVGLDRRQFKGE